MADPTLSEIVASVAHSRADRTGIPVDELIARINVASLEKEFQRGVSVELPRTIWEVLLFRKPRFVKSVDPIINIVVSRIKNAEKAILAERAASG